MKPIGQQFVIKASVAAILAAIAGGAAAQVNLDTGVGARKLASEQNIIGSVPVTGAGLTAGVTFGANFPLNTQAFVRVDITGGGATFSGAPTATHLGGSSANCAGNAANSFSDSAITVAQGGTTATSFVIYSVAPSSASTGLCNVNSFNIAANINVTSAATVSMQYRLYETLTAAVNQTALTALKDRSAPYVTFGPSFSTAVSAFGPSFTSAVANVGTVPAYTAFTTANVSSTTVALATVNMTVATGFTLANGDVATLPILVNANTAGQTVVTVAGDFTGAQNTGGTYTTPATARIFLSSSASCSTVNSTFYSATSLSASGATFNSINSTVLGAGMTLCYTPNAPTFAIPASSYTGTVALTANSGFTVSGFGLAIGSITRNGTTMVVPLAQIPSGFIARLILVNNGTQDRTYTVTPVTETGTTVTLTGALASGTLAAGKTAVIDLHTGLMAITGTSPRTALAVVVNGPQNQISGMYQIVNTTSFGISNHVLDYKQ